MLLEEVSGGGRGSRRPRPPRDPPDRDRVAPRVSEGRHLLPHALPLPLIVVVLIVAAGILAQFLGYGIAVLFSKKPEPLPAE